MYASFPLQRCNDVLLGGFSYHRIVNISICGLQITSHLAPRTCFDSRSCSFGEFALVSAILDRVKASLSSGISF